jgi:hypothetical protein
MTVDVSVINFGDTGTEPFVIRSLAEGYGATSLLKNAGKPSELLSAIRNTDANCIVLSLHGDEKGFILPELESQVAATEKYSKHLSAENLTKELKLQGGVVISTACHTGVEDFGKAFLGAGAKAYIAPEGYPEGNAIPFFLSHFFYLSLARNQSLGTAFCAAQRQDTETRLFRMYTSQD